MGERNQESNDQKIIFDYLREQHKRMLNNVDSLDQKIAQTIALNSIILSFILDKLIQARSYFLFSAGLTLIVVSLVIGIFTYAGKVFHDSPAPSFYKEDKGLKLLRKYLIEDNSYNVKINERKIDMFNLLLKFSVIGLILIIVGYYV